jgi:hypothetical protein
MKAWLPELMVRYDALVERGAADEPIKPLPFEMLRNAVLTEPAFILLSASA